MESRHREAGCKPIPELAALKIQSGSLGRTATDVNEHFAFHGATSDTTQAIRKSGFDPQRGGEGAGRWFGVAGYFALNASRAIVRLFL